MHTQDERGIFYQNFVNELLKGGACVGWHWFKYGDNDPTDPRNDPSNRDSNKGMVTWDFRRYEPLVDRMREINNCTYNLSPSMKSFREFPAEAGICDIIMSRLLWGVVLLSEKLDRSDNSEEGRRYMCKAMEEFGNRREAHGKAVGKTEGIAEGKRETMFATAKRMLKDGILALKDIARYSGLTLAQVKKLQAEMA